MARRSCSFKSSPRELCHLPRACGGRGLCGRCQITPSFGEFAKWSITSAAGSLGPVTSSEHDYSGRRPLEAPRRLGCQATVRADAVVDVPVESQVHRPVVRKRVDLPDLVVDPLVTARYVEVPEPGLGDERAEAELLTEALTAEWGIEGAVVDARVLPALHPAITAGQRRVTAIVHDDATVLAVRPGFDEAVLGVAVDVGSTTVDIVPVDSGKVNTTARTDRERLQMGQLVYILAGFAGLGLAFVWLKWLHGV